MCTSLKISLQIVSGKYFTSNRFYEKKNCQKIQHWVFKIKTSTDFFYNNWIMFLINTLCFFENYNTDLVEIGPILTKCRIL